MARAKFSTGLCMAVFLAGVHPALAQLSPSEPDPLARIRDAAKTNVQACSATEETLCEQVAPKIIANAQGDSPEADNLHRLTDSLQSKRAASPAEPPVIALALAGFRDAGVEARTEKFLVAAKDPGHAAAEIVIAEIRGREKPEEWVLLGANIDSARPGYTALESATDAALVMEAARDIHLTGVLPRRSIRFVLFGGEAQGMTGAWAYLRGHRDELDKARGALFFDTYATHPRGFVLNGRRDMEPGVREAMDPVKSLVGEEISLKTSDETDSMDFLLEGIPTIVATSLRAAGLGSYPSLSDPEVFIDLWQLKRNTAIAAVTAFGLAERAEPIGARQSRGEIEILLESSGLAGKLKAEGIWPLWESGKRGREQ